MSHESISNISNISFSEDENRKQAMLKNQRELAELLSMPAESTKADFENAVKKINNVSKKFNEASSKYFNTLEQKKHQNNFDNLVARIETSPSLEEAQLIMDQYNKDHENQNVPGGAMAKGSIAVVSFNGKKYELIHSHGGMNNLEFWPEGTWPASKKIGK